PNQTPGVREGTVDRAPGLSVRLKLTLSYAGFLMLAGAVLLAAGYFSLSRGVHPGVVFFVRSHADLLRNFAPIAAIVMAFLLVFGLVGGWILAGRMLAPLTRIADATRMAASGSLSHRIQLEGRNDQFRAPAEAFPHPPRRARILPHAPRPVGSCGRSNRNPPSSRRRTRAHHPDLRRHHAHERFTRAPATDDHEPAAQRDRAQPPGTRHGVGHDRRS